MPLTPAMRSFNFNNGVRVCVLGPDYGDYEITVNVWHGEQRLYTNKKILDDDELIEFLMQLKKEFDQEG